MPNHLALERTSPDEQRDRLEEVYHVIQARRARVLQQGCSRLPPSAPDVLLVELSLEVLESADPHGDTSLTNKLIGVDGGQ